jgi:hypothetical protein
MKKYRFPKLLSVAILSASLILVAYKAAEMPAGSTPKKQNTVIKPVSFRVVNNQKFESGFVGWNLYRIVRSPNSSADGQGC